MAFVDGLKKKAPQLSKAAWEEVRPVYDELRPTLSSREKVVAEINQRKFKHFSKGSLTVSQLREQERKWRAEDARSQILQHPRAMPMLSGPRTVATNEAESHVPDAQKTAIQDLAQWSNVFEHGSERLPTCVEQMVSSKDIDEDIIMHESVPVDSENGGLFQLQSVLERTREAQRSSIGMELPPTLPMMSSAPSSRPSSIGRAAHSVRSGHDRGRKSNRASSVSTRASSLSSIASRILLGFSTQRSDYWRAGQVFGFPVRSERYSEYYRVCGDYPMSDVGYFSSIRGCVVVDCNEGSSWCVRLCPRPISSTLKRTDTPPSSSIVCVHVGRSVGAGRTAKIYIRRDRDGLCYQDVDECIDFADVQNIKHTARVVPIGTVVDLASNGYFQKSLQAYTLASITRKLRRKAEKSFQPGLVFTRRTSTEVPSDAPCYQAEDTRGSFEYYIAIKVSSTSCWAVRIQTYGGKGLLGDKFSAAEIANHAIAYTADRPLLMDIDGEMEPIMSKEAIKVVPDLPDPEFQLHRASRINFRKIISIEHRHSVTPIGIVHYGSMLHLHKHWRSCSVETAPSAN